jgi:ATP-dependent phosphoenolpyruvate carboxykinase
MFQSLKTLALVTIYHIDNIQEGSIGKPKIYFSSLLTLLGLPPISRLTPGQAAYFISGYTAKWQELKQE